MAQEIRRRKTDKSSDKPDGPKLSMTEDATKPEPPTSRIWSALGSFAVVNGYVLVISFNLFALCHLILGTDETLTFVTQVLQKGLGGWRTVTIDGHEVASVVLGHVRYHAKERPLLFFFHVVFSPIAYIAGVFQLTTSLREKYPKVHRFLGYVYIINLYLGLGVGGIGLSTHAFPGITGLYGLMFMSLTCILCATIGLYCIRCKNYDSHREWMVRSYGILFMSETVIRLLNSFWLGHALEITHPDPSEHITGQAHHWGSMFFLMPWLGLFIADVYLQMTKSTSRPQPKKEMLFVTVMVILTSALVAVPFLSQQLETVPRELMTVNHVAVK